MTKFISKYHLGTRWRLRVLKHFLKFSKKDSVLDAGCAEGWISYVISKKVMNVTAVDISKKTIEMNKRVIDKDNIGFLVCDLNKLNKSIKKKFDKIYSLDVLEHAHGFLNIIHNFSNALKKNGELFMTIPIGNHGHFEFKDKKKLKKLFEKEKLKIVFFETCNRPLFSNALNSFINMLRKGTKNEQKEVDVFEDTLSESLRKKPTLLFRLYQVFFYLTYWITFLDLKPYRKAKEAYFIKLKKL